jgi:hypothetical protein
MAIPRRILVIAAGALATGAVLYVRNKMREQKERQPAPSTSSTQGTPATPGEKADQTGEAPPASTPATGAVKGSQKELSLFLAGESWYDEVGWQGIWEREAIESPEGWLRSTGKDVLVEERKKLAAHPALLAGCRRRWIVVCRYAGIDVADSASLWNATEPS